MLDMGPVLPDTPEGDVQEVTVLNEGAWDVEIFSLDFDKVMSNFLRDRKKTIPRVILLCWAPMFGMD